MCRVSVYSREVAENRGWFVLSGTFCAHSTVNLLLVFYLMTHGPPASGGWLQCDKQIFCVGILFLTNSIIICDHQAVRTLALLTTCGRSVLLNVFSVFLPPHGTPTAKQINWWNSGLHHNSTIGWHFSIATIPAFEDIHLSRFQCVWRKHSIKLYIPDPRRVEVDSFWEECISRTCLKWIWMPTLLYMVQKTRQIVVIIVDTVTMDSFDWSSERSIPSDSTTDTLLLHDHCGVTEDFCPFDNVWQTKILPQLDEKKI